MKGGVSIMLELTADGVGIYLLVGVVLASAAMLQSAIGFGFNLLAAPVLTLFLNPRIVVPALIVAWLPVGLVLAVGHRRQVNAPRLGFLLLGAAPGILLGVWLLSAMDPSGLKRLIGVVTVLSTLLLITTGGKPLARPRCWTVLAGGFSGVLGASTAMSGPPVLLLGLNQRWEMSGFRADLHHYFTVLGIVVAGLLAWRLMIPAASLKLAAAGVPGLALGLWGGLWLAPRISARWFRGLVAALLCAVGLIPWLSLW